VTRYADIPGHPLQHVPEQALAATVEALTDAITWKDVRMDREDIEPVAHAILAAGLAAMEHPS
jgi:hypothetical protein